MSLTLTQVYERLRAKFPQGVTGVVECAGDPYAVIPAAAIVDVCKFLRDDPELRFELCASISGADDTVDFWVVYHLYSVAKNQRVRVKARVSEASPELPSAVPLWASANWMEREVWDLYGVRFRGHPDLRRILLYDGFEGHPLRKDYPKEKRQPLVGPRN